MAKLCTFLCAYSEIIATQKWTKMYRNTFDKKHNKIIST